MGKEEKNLLDRMPAMAMRQGVRRGFSEAVRETGLGVEQMEVGQGGRQEL